MAALSPISKILGIVDGSPLENVLEFVGRPDVTSEVSKEFSEVSSRVWECFFEAYKRDPVLKGYVASNSVVLTPPGHVQAVARRVLLRSNDIVMCYFHGNRNLPQPFNQQLAARFVKDIGFDCAKLSEASKIADKCAFINELAQERGAGDIWEILGIKALYNPVFNFSPVTLPNLRTLDLRDLHLTTLPLEIAELRGLRHLDLRDNLLTDLPFQSQQLAQLTSLDLSNNQLAHLRPEIRFLTELETLDLSGNKLLDLPVELGELRHLRGVDLLGNPNLVLSPEVRAVLAEIPNPNHDRAVALDDHHIPVRPFPPIIVYNAPGLPLQARLDAVAAQQAAIRAHLDAMEAQIPAIAARLGVPIEENAAVLPLQAPPVVANPQVQIANPPALPQAANPQPQQDNNVNIPPQAPRSFLQKVRDLFAGLVERIITWLRAVEAWANESD